MCCRYPGNITEYWRHGCWFRNQAKHYWRSKRVEILNSYCLTNDPQIRKQFHACIYISVLVCEELYLGVGKKDEQEIIIKVGDFNLYGRICFFLKECLGHKWKELIRFQKVSITVIHICSPIYFSFKSSNYYAYLHVRIILMLQFWDYNG